MIELPLLESLDVQTEIKFNNVVLQDGAGRIQTIIQWQDAIRTFNLSRQILYPPQRQALVNFFLSVKASGEAFLYKDKSDFKCRSITTPYGSSTYGTLYPIAGDEYQICKAYSIGDTTYLRPISHPVNVIVYNGGIEQTGWVLGDNGRITISTAFDGIEFDFFVPVRFQDEDLSSVITATYNDNSRILYSLSRLVLREVKVLFDVSPVDTFEASSAHVLTLDLLKGQYIERVQERVTEQGSGFEFIERQESESVIELQQRKILRKPEMDYLIALWLCVKGDGGAFGFLRFDSSIITARFITKALSYQFEAYFGENEAVFNLGEIAVQEFKISKIDTETYVITFIDTTSLSAIEISNINAAIAQLRPLLASDVYGSTELADKYVKAPINKGDERYMIWPASDYRDNTSEPKKYLFLAFVDESNTNFGAPPQTTDNSYHYIPRNVGVEPTNLWTADFNTFDDVYPDFEIFNYLIFSPTGFPSLPSEDAFNPHIIDVVAGNNGYPTMYAYNFVAKPYWDESASGQDIYDAIIDFIG